MEVNLKKCGCTIETLAPGDVFMPIIEDTGYYMKVKPYNSCSSYNAVHLATGLVFAMPVNTPVCYIDVILVDNKRSSENG